MDLSSLYLWVGFLASYSVIAIQFRLWEHGLSNSERFRWYILWSRTVLLFTLWYGWSVNDGDISYGRLNKIPWQPIQWYQKLTSSSCSPYKIWCSSKHNLFSSLWLEYSCLGKGIDEIMGYLVGLVHI